MIFEPKINAGFMIRVMSINVLIRLLCHQHQEKELSLIPITFYLLTTILISSSGS